MGQRIKEAETQKERMKELEDMKVQRLQAMIARNHSKEFTSLDYKVSKN